MGLILRKILSGPSELCVKALLAPSSGPGLGNGVLQDISVQMPGINPKSKLGALTEFEKTDLFDSVKHTLREMTEKGGRNTEKDLFGKPGGYATIQNSKTQNQPFPRCGGSITRQAYLGGNVYFCPHCQPEEKVPKV